MRLSICLECSSLSGLRGLRASSLFGGLIPSLLSQELAIAIDPLSYMVAASTVISGVDYYLSARTYMLSQK